MKNLLARSFVLLIVIVGFLYGAPAPAVSAAPLQAAQAIYALTDLGASGDVVLRGPFETTSLRFDLPPAWVLQDGVNLILKISAYVGNATSAPVGPIQAGTVSGALLDVYFNGRLQKSLPLATGENLIYAVPVSVDSLVSPFPDGRFQISFTLDAAYDCWINQHTTVKIAGESQAVIPYVQTSLPLDLHRLPWPIYQPHAKVPGPAAVVIPSSPTAAQLNAALMVMGTFGRMTNGQLPITMITADQLTEGQRNTNDLVFVGPASAFPVLAAVQFPVAIKGNNYASNEMQADDGIVQMAASPWNNEKSLLVVGGSSDVGLLKAAQALSTGNLQTGSAPTYSVVAQVHPIVATGLLNSSSSSPSFDYKLSDLGYSLTTEAGIGIVWFTYEFNVPPGQVADTGPYLDLVYSYSTLVDPNRSSADVYLNGDRVGSITLDAANPNSATAHVPLPLSLIRPGRNALEVAAVLLPKTYCSVFSFNDLWMTVFSESVLHLPLTLAATTADVLQDLRAYPKPFNNDPSLGSVAFILPHDDAKAWAAAGQVAYGLGTEATGSAFRFETAFDGQLSDEVRGRDLIVVGLPAQLTILQDFKAALPAYFEKDSNVAILQSQEVVYRIPAGKDLGYIQLFRSPWNSQRAVLAVLGTTVAGASSAGQMLASASLRDALRGNFATVDGQQTLVYDTRTGLGLGSLVPEIAAGAPTTSQGTGTGNNAHLATQSAEQQRQLVLGGVIVLVVVMVLIAVLAMWARRRNRPQRR